MEWFLSPAADASRGVKRYTVGLARAAAIVSMNFMQHKCMLRASALSFTTILSIVPLFAFAFAILKGLGVQNRLEPVILEHLTAGSGDVAGRIISYINNTNMASLGVVGLATLVFTVVSLLGSIEETFNQIWGVDENRTVYRRFSDYLSVVVSGPLLLLAGMSITTSLQSQSIVRWLLERAYIGDFLLILFHVVPYLSVWIALVCLYVFMPNTRVRIGSALVGGILAGTAWQAAQWGYIHFQIGVAKYNAIYGTLAALPVFMAWIYASWLIVLFGAEIVAAHQSRKTLPYDYDPGDLSPASREAITLMVMLSVADSFLREERPWSAERLADERRVPLRTMRSILSKLVSAGYLVVVEGDRTYYPARDPEHVRVGALLKELRHHGAEIPIRESDRVGKLAVDLSSSLDAGGVDSLDDLTLKDLVERLSKGDAGE